MERDFYPRPPRGGRRIPGAAPADGRQFLSTPSARRATHFFFGPVQHLAISIHALREEGDLRQPGCAGHSGPISIHALREEGDRFFGRLRRFFKQFLSTPSARRATLSFQPNFVLEKISIHALREEGDAASFPAWYADCNFYPRPPRGGRRAYRTAAHNKAVFLSTPSARRATPRGARVVVTGWNFYPRPPRGGRHGEWEKELDAQKFLSTPSARRATLSESRCSSFRQYFYPRPPRGGRRRHYGARPKAHGFLSTPSARRATVCS